MAATAQHRRAYSGPALLSFGFRPFFLFGAAWAALVVAIWLLVLTGNVALPVAYSPIEWHVHELVYGYVPAVVAGFLLTAVPNWTGRLPVIGKPLTFLFAIWALGRLAIACSALVGKGAAAVVDLAFLLCLMAVIAREIMAADNRRNLKVLVLVALLWVGDAVFHAEAISGSEGGYGARLGVAAAVLLIALIGGRIVPSFTRNWLAQNGSQTLPEPFARFDMAAMGVSAVALISWVATPTTVWTGVLAVVAGVLNVWRLVRWRGWLTWREPLVLVLHAGFAFLPIGFLLVALSIFAPQVIAQSGAVHAWTAGGIGVMTLAVMTRASLGHTGRSLNATAAIAAIYGAAVLAATARILAGFSILPHAMLLLSASAWIGAFGGFVAIFAPILTKPRQ